MMNSGLNQVNQRPGLGNAVGGSSMRGTFILHIIEFVSNKTENFTKELYVTQKPTQLFAQVAYVTGTHPTDLI